MKASFCKSALLALGAIALLASCNPKELDSVLVSISASSASFADGKVNLDLTLSGKASADVTVELASSGTVPAAALSFDKSVTVSKGSSSAKVPVSVDASGLSVGSYEAVFTIASASGAKVDASQNSCKVALEVKAEEVVPPTVSISNYSEAFSDGKASITLALDAAAKEDVTVTFEVKTEADGYVAIPAEALSFENPAKIPAGQLSKEVVVTLDLDAIPAGTTCYAVIAIASVSSNAQAAASKTKVYIEASKQLVPNYREDWNISYGGETEIDGTPADIISVSGMGQNNYYVYVYSKGVVDHYFPNGVKDFLEYLESSVVEYINGGNEPVILTGDQDAPFNLLSVGNYEVWVVGCTEAGHINGDYAKYEFSKEATPEIIAAYSKWLGKWNVTRGNLTDEWTISEYIPGARFLIQGIDGDNPVISDIQIEAYYDASRDEIVLSTQECKDYSSGGKNYIINLVGLIEYSGNLSPVTGDYDIAYVKRVDENNAQVVSAGKITLSGGGEFEVCGMCFFASDVDPNSNNGYVFNGQVFYSWPEDMSKIVANDNDPDYNALLGLWTIKRNHSTWDDVAQDFVDQGVVDDVWEITPMIAGDSFYITGFEGFSDVTAVAKYDSKTKSFTVREQDIEVGEYSLCLCGLFYYGEDEYLYDFGATIFTASLDAGTGQINLTPGNAGNYGIFHGVQLFEYDEESEGYYSFHGEGYPLPNALTKVVDAQRPSARVFKSRARTVSTPDFGGKKLIKSRKAVSLSVKDAVKSL
ncbi:MAG: hypothetical protein IK031_04180 [Bacteroidales bacterium]|nr:hypothetical protein [Bacteroidales bacterium]